MRRGKLKKRHKIPLTDRQILTIVQMTNLSQAAKIIGMSDFALRHYLIRQNLYTAARTMQIHRKNRKPTINRYDDYIPEEERKDK